MSLFTHKNFQTTSAIKFTAVKLFGLFILVSYDDQHNIESMNAFKVTLNVLIKKRFSLCRNIKCSRRMNWKYCKHCHCFAIYVFYFLNAQQYVSNVYLDTDSGRSYQSTLLYKMCSS